MHSVLFLSAMLCSCLTQILIAMNLLPTRLLWFAFQMLCAHRLLHLIFYSSFGIYCTRPHCLYLKTYWTFCLWRIWLTLSSISYFASGEITKFWIGQFSMRCFSPFGPSNQSLAFQKIMHPHFSADWISCIAAWEHMFSFVTPCTFLDCIWFDSNACLISVWFEIV